MFRNFISIGYTYLGNVEALKGSSPEVGSHSSVCEINFTNSARVFAFTDSKSVQHCVGDRNSCLYLVRGSCRATSDDIAVLNTTATPPNKIQPWDQRTRSIGGESGRVGAKFECLAIALSLATLMLMVRTSTTTTTTIVTTMSASLSPGTSVSPFSLFYSAAFNPATKHTPNFIKSFLKGERFLLSQCFYINRKTQEYAKHIDFSTYRR